ncbi:MAG: hypothetical protein QOG71_373 [Pyrinomonadaceae bacterium]|nr:hypothetical protein [Pyrinomonadaceae bacterium]
MKKFALALLLALHCPVAFAAARDGGINPRAEAARGAQRSKSPAAAQRRGKRANAAQGKRVGANAVAPLVPVKEIDADGLKNLLPRADAPEAARPLLLNFWATWCTPCRREFPDLVKIGADYGGRGLEFALVSADDVSDIKTAVPEFLREMRAAAMPAYLLNATDTEAAIAQVDPAWGGELPATFLFDRQGKLAYRHFGIINASELRGEIDKVLSQK